MARSRTPPNLMRVMERPPGVAEPMARVKQLEARVAAEREAAARWKALACDFAQALQPFTMGGETKIEGGDKDNPPRAVHHVRVPHSRVGRAVQLLNAKGDLCRTEQHRAEREAHEDRNLTAPAAAAASRPRRAPITPRASRATRIA